jgi:hypothetical protein
MSKELEDIDREPLNPEKSEDEVRSIKNRRAFSQLRLELSDDDLKSPGVQKMLLNEIDRLEKDLIDLGSYRENFHVVDKEKAVLQQKYKTLIWSEVLYSFGLALGPLLIGVSFSIKDYSVFILWSGVALSIMSIIARIIDKWI